MALVAYAYETSIGADVDYHPANDCGRMWYLTAGNTAINTWPVQWRTNHWTDAQTTASPYGRWEPVDTGTSAWRIPVNWTAYNSYTTSPIMQTREDRLAEMIRARSAPAVVHSRSSVGHAPDEREKRARATLLRIIGPDRYREFLRRGFVVVDAPDAKTYHVYPGHRKTRVFEGTKCTAVLCVVWTGDFTPTDCLIMRLLMLNTDPEAFWAKAIRTNPVRLPKPSVDVRRTVPLADLKPYAAVAPLLYATA